VEKRRYYIISMW